MATYSQLGVYVNGRIAQVDVSSAGNVLNVAALQIGSTSLSETDLDTLVGGSSDAQSLHNHDSAYADISHNHDATYAPISHSHDDLYFTESELASTADGSSGASLIGVDQTPAFSNISGATVQAIIESIDSALSTAGISSFDEASFEIYDTANNDRKVVFNVNRASAGSTTITVGDNAFDTDQVLSDVSDNASAASAAQSDIDSHKDGGANKHDASEIDVETAGNYTTVADLETNLGALDTAIFGNAGDISTLQGEVIKKDGTVDFTANQSMGSHKITSLSNGVDSGDAVNKGQLDALESSLSSLINNFEWQESALDYIADNTVAPLTEVSGDRYVLSHDGGSPHADWDGASAGDIVEFDGSAWVAVTPTTGMFISVDDNSSGIYQWGGSAWSLKYFEATTADEITLTKNGFQLAVKAGGISDTELAANAVTEAKINNGAVTEAKIGSGAVTEAKIGSGAVTEAKIGSGAVTADKIGADAVTAVKLNSDVVGTDQGLSQEADGSLLVESVVIKGTNSNASQLDAGTVVYISGNGSFDAADASAIATAEGIGILLENTAAAGTGKIMVQGIYDFGSSQGWTANTVLFLSTTTGALTSTAPSASGEVIKQIGIAWNAQAILLEKSPAVEIL